MRRILVLALAAISCSALAQSDVPANHWASKSVTDLYQLGVLKGYPDGNFRGNRPVTRYEMAQAINAFYLSQKTVVDGLAGQLDDLTSKLRAFTPSQQVDVEGLAEIRRRLESAETNVKELQVMKSDVKDLNTRFETMLQDLRKLRESVKGARENMRNPRQ